MRTAKPPRLRAAALLVLEVRRGSRLRDAEGGVPYVSRESTL
jgi:hypothetical protein